MSSVPDAEPQRVLRRYSNVAVTFHWVTAILVLTQAWLGLAFSGQEPGAERMELFTWHKTVGATILLITLARLAYRLTNPPPPFSPDLPAWERIAATWNHRIFYFLLIAMPLSGLTAVSANEDGATTELAFGIPLPVIPGVSESLGELAGGLHEAMVFILVALIVLHLAAALKHQFFDRYPVSGRMPPFTPPDGRPVVIGQGSRSAPPET